MRCRSVITFQRRNNPLHFSNNIWLNRSINRISTKYNLLGRRAKELPCCFFKSQLKISIIIFAAIFHATEFPSWENQVNIATSDRMRYSFCCSLSICVRHLTLVVLHSCPPFHRPCELRICSSWK